MATAWVLARRGDRAKNRRVAIDRQGRACLSLIDGTQVVTTAVDLGAFIRVGKVSGVMRRDDLGTP
ncbi:MAG: hypothetical protein GEU82_05235 [Luteitalea sp.]|nr:hypothetical protein [Luteitalea sp.]